VNVYLIY